VPNVNSDGSGVKKTEQGNMSNIISYHVSYRTISYHITSHHIISYHNISDISLHIIIISDSCFIAREFITVFLFNGYGLKFQKQLKQILRISKLSALSIIYY